MGEYGTAVWHSRGVLAGLWAVPGYSWEFWDRVLGRYGGMALSELAWFLGFGLVALSGRSCGFGVLACVKLA